MPLLDIEDVVVHRVVLADEDDKGFRIESWGRDTAKVATEFCRRPKWPAHVTDHFIAVDGWGGGNIIAATPDLSNWVGKSFRQFKREAH